MAEDSHRGIGEVLRQAREAAGLQISDLAATTRVNARYIAALEAEDWAVVPGSVIGRGFVRVLARELRQDPDRLMEAYRASREEVDASPDHSLPESDWDVPLRSERGSRPLWVGLGAVLLLVGGVWFWLPRAPEQEPASPKTEVSVPPPVAAPAAARAAAPASAPVAVAVAAPGPHRLGIQAVEKVWVRVVADGGEARDRLLEPGEHAEFVGEQTLRVKLGSAGSVRLTWDGTALLVPGAAGEVKTLEFPAAATALRP